MSTAYAYFLWVSRWQLAVGRWSGWSVGRQESPIGTGWWRTTLRCRSQTTLHAAFAVAVIFENGHSCLRPAPGEVVPVDRLLWEGRFSRAMASALLVTRFRVESANVPCGDAVNQMAPCWSATKPCGPEWGVLSEYSWNTPVFGSSRPILLAPCPVYQKRTIRRTCRIMRPRLRGWNLVLFDRYRECSGCAEGEDCNGQEEQEGFTQEHGPSSKEIVAATSSHRKARRGGQFAKRSAVVARVWFQLDRLLRSRIEVSARHWYRPRS